MNAVNNKLYFLSKNDTLQLLFNEEIQYDDLCDNTIDIWNKTTDWGLPYYLGFNKKVYTSVAEPKFKFTYTTDQEVSTNIINGDNPVNMFKKNIFRELNIILMNYLI